MSFVRRPIRLLAAVVVAAVMLAPTFVRADEDDPAGWSVSTDARGRAFLKYVEKAGGPRLLFIGCLRDADEFFVNSKAVPGMEVGTDVELRLIVPDAEWAIVGEVAETGDGALTFEKEWEADATEIGEIRRQLLPVLTAPGPIVLQVGNSETVELTLEDLPPRNGIAASLARFEKFCFRGE